MLAHELAHICRGDFMTGAGRSDQPDVALLQSAGALAGRAAAAGAGARRRRLGSPAFRRQAIVSATLAQMALRRDSRALTWPAEPFLPSRGTFVRRIEMLRNTKPNPSCSSASRGTTAHDRVRFVSSGSRWPVCTGLPACQPHRHRPQHRPRARRRRCQRIVQPGLPARRRQDGCRRATRRLCSSAASETLLESIKQSPGLQRGIRRVARGCGAAPFVLGRNRRTPAEPDRTPMVPFPSGGVLRTSKPQDWKSLFEESAPGSHAGSPSRRSGLFQDRRDK